MKRLTIPSVPFNEKNGKEKQFNRGKFVAIQYIIQQRFVPSQYPLLQID